MPSAAGTWWDDAAVLWILYKCDRGMRIDEIVEELEKFTAYDLEQVERIAKNLEKEFSDD